MSGYLLSETLAEYETVLSGSDLDLKIIDRIGPITTHTPTNLSNKGVLVRSDTTNNRDQYRDQHLARVLDDITVEFLYLIVATKQKDCRAAALLLEEQIRVLITSRAPQLASHTTFRGVSRGLHPLDASWWFCSMKFTTARDASLGGA